MPDDTPGQRTTGAVARTSREALDAALTRRRLITAAAVIAGVGVTDAACSGRRGGSATGAVRRGQTPATPASTRAGAGAQHRAVTQVDRATARHHGAAHHPHTHGHHEHGSGGGHHRHGHGHAAEHVDLPRARTRVRTRPAYYIDDVIPHPPAHAIALTVDDGPSAEYTPKVLRLLDKYQMRASFCVIGMSAEAYPRLIRDIVRAGHAVVNHSFTHVQPFSAQTEKRIVHEITATQRAIEKAAKVTPELFRAPGGDWSHFVFRAVAAYDLLPLDWDIDPRDWAMPGVKPIRRAMLAAHPGEIVLCHDGGGDRHETIRALKKVLPTWKHRGYTTMPLFLPTRQPTTPASPPASPPASSTPSPTGTGSPTP